MADGSWIVRVPAHPGPPPIRPSGLADWSGWQACPCSDIEVRKDVKAGITAGYRLQCIRCGAGKGMVSKAKVKTYFGMKDFDHDLAKAWEVKRMAYFQEQRRKIEESERDHQATFDAWYAAYRQCKEWIQLRTKVLERDRYTCNGCHGKATLAHHLTYERVGYELLCDLVAMCDECHRRLHPKYYP